MKKSASPLGITVFILEELGDARLRCNQLKDYLSEATELIEKSDKRDHFFEVAGHLLHGIPDTLMRMSKSLDAAAMAAAKWDYESVKEDLRPEKAEQLEDALKDVRTRRVKRKSSNTELTTMKTHEAAEELNRIARTVTETGRINTDAILRLISALEHNTKRASSSNDDVADLLRKMAKNLGSSESRPSRAALASVLRRVVAETMEVGTEKRAGEPFDYNLEEGFEHIRDLAIRIYRRGSSGQLFQAFQLLSFLVVDIGMLVDSFGADVGPIAARMQHAIMSARRLTRGESSTSAYDDPSKIASDEKQSRFEEGKPADPTEHMDEADAEKWKTEHDKNKDKFKEASWSLFAEDEEPEAKEADEDKEAWTKAKSLVPKTNKNKKYAEDDKLSRFEEGKPADPTKDMDPEDAAEWKSNTEEYGDKFKEAGSKPLAEEKRSRFEKGKPADPTEAMDEDAAAQWKENTEEYGDKFKD